MAKKIDKTDLLVLKELQENCRMTNLKLAEKVKLSPAPTLERVKKLEHMHVIEGYHAKVNPEKLGLNVQTFVFISLAWRKDNAFNKFIEKIQDIPEVIECHVITGEADVILKIICKD
ncbi:MAG TPA: Lrp/AsnC family transcriptional regulator, partial [Phaeodactylibacter sp.]|nr:Lrp/AsnC family transcriptional regulator [Phaeodactylibacter sp.]